MQAQNAEMQAAVQTARQEAAAARASTNQGLIDTRLLGKPRTRRGMDGALTALLKANGVSEETATKLSRAPFRITTVKQLANAFDTRAEIKSSFADHGEVQITDLVQITGPKQSWREHRRTRA